MKVFDAIKGVIGIGNAIKNRSDNKDLEMIIEAVHDAFNRTEAERHDDVKSIIRDIRFMATQIKDLTQQQYKLQKPDSQNSEEVNK